MTGLVIFGYGLPAYLFLTMSHISLLVMHLHSYSSSHWVPHFP